MRANRATRSFVVSIGHSLATAVFGLLLTPILLRNIGTEQLGVLRATSEILAYLALLDMGLSFALPGMLSEAVATRDDAFLLQALAAAARVYQWLAIIGVAILGICAWWIPRFFDLAPAVAADLRYGILAAGIPVVAARFSPLRNLLEARQAGYQVQLVVLAGVLVGFGLAVGAAAARWGIMGQMLASALTTLFTTLMIAGIELRKHPENWQAIIGRVSVPRNVASRLWSHSLAGLTINLCGRAALHSDNIVIGVFLGPAAVVPFFATQRLIQLALAQAFALGNASWAGLADIYHQGDIELVSRRLAELTKYTIVIGLAGIFPAAIWSSSFVTIWIGAEFYAGHFVAACAGGVALSHALISIWGWIFSGIGATHLLVRWAIASCVINVVTGIAATKLLGMVGPLIGSTVAFATTTIWWLPWLMRSQLKIDTSRFRDAMLKPIAMAVVYFMPWAFLGARFPPEIFTTDRIARILVLVIVAGGSALGFLLFSWFLILTDGERADWRSRISSLRSKRKLKSS